MPDGVKRKKLEMPRRQDPRVTDEKIEPAFRLGCYFAGPTLDDGFVRNVATAQSDGPARRLFEVRDLPCDIFVPKTR